MRFQFKNGVEICLSQPPEIISDGLILMTAYYEDKPMYTDGFVVSAEQLVEKLITLKNYNSNYEIPIDIVFEH